MVSLWGGLTGIWLSIHAPDKFDKIIVANTAAKIGNQHAWQGRATSVQANGLQPTADTAPSRWFSNGFIQNHPNIVKNLSDSLAKGDKDGYANCCQALAIADLRDELENTKTPIIVITGEKDPVTTVADGQFIVDNAPNARLVTLNASHISNIEQADKFTKAIKDFLTKT